MEPGLGPGVQAMLVTERTINEMAEKGGGGIQELNCFRA